MGDLVSEADSHVPLAAFSPHLTAPLRVPRRHLGLPAYPWSSHRLPASPQPPQSTPRVPARLHMEPPECPPASTQMPPTPLLYHPRRLYLGLPFSSPMFPLVSNLLWSWTGQELPVVLISFLQLYAMDPLYTLYYSDHSTVSQCYCYSM